MVESRTRPLTDSEARTWDDAPWLSWALVELLDDGTVLRTEYGTEGEAQAALWKMLDDAPDQEERDSLADVLRIEKL
jgi:hypothetical protein